MKFNSSKLKVKSILLSSTILLFTFLTGCSDSADDKSASKSSSAISGSTAAPQIEVIKNENAKEIKVASKTASEDQSKSYYYNYNNESAVNQEQKTAIDANMNVRSPYEKLKVSLLVRKMSKEFIVKCSACHNDYANGIIGPSLLGKSSDYIYDAIAKFKTGENKNVLMTDLINMMDDKEIKKLADEIFEFNKEIKEMRK
ncbi:MAG: hypothetical protein K8R44_04470 [Sulfurimonas sp.]|nr:hypothetical protein [Sulfurimonas sp.]